MIFAPSAADVSVGDTIDECSVFHCSSFCGGVIEIPSGSSITSLTFYHCMSEKGTFVPLHDSDGNAVTMTVAAGNAYNQPDALNECAYVKALGNVDGTIHWFGKGI